MARGLKYRLRVRAELDRLLQRARRSLQIGAPRSSGEYDWRS